MRLSGLSGGSVAVLLVGLSGGSPAFAQSADMAQTTQDDAELDEAGIITVTGQRQRGAVIGDIAPELQYNSGDIRALGVSSVAELLEELAPQTRSDRGRGEQPVTLLNGRRISGFAEIRDIPSEAIERVDILPEEAALKYGYSANQRVVNIVLRRRFHSIVGEVEGGATTQGGGKQGEVEANLLRIQRDRRLNLNIEYERLASLSEADRKLRSRTGGVAVDSAGNPIDDSTALGRYRTIRPATKTLGINSVYARTIFGTVGATVNATLDVTDSDSLRGLPGARLTLPASNPTSPFPDDTRLTRYLGTSPLAQDVEGVTGHLGVTLDKDVGTWRTSLTGSFDRSVTRTRTDAVRGAYVSDLQAGLDAGDPAVDLFAPLLAPLPGVTQVDRAKSTSNSGGVDLVATGPLAQLPAGPLSATFKGGFDAFALDTRSTRAGVTTASDPSRTDLNGKLSFDIPLTSKRNNVLAAIGDLSLNLNAAVDRYSDFGTLGGWGYGANWKPLAGLSLIASVNEDRTPPTVQQLGNPTVSTPFVRIYDYVRGTTVDISQISGGNPLLDADRRRVVKLGLTAKPFKADVTLTANYIHSRLRNAVAGFPEATAAIEAAFPDRFTRDDDGNLLQIDARPINFERQSSSELRWGITFSHKLKTSEKLIEAMRNSRRAKEAMERRAAAQAAREAAGQGTQAGARGGGGGGGRPGGGFGGFGGRGGAGQGGRLQFSLFHTWHFRDEVLIRQGLPVLDLLKGDTLGSSGGTAEHELEAQFTYANNGIGGRLTGNWRSGTTVNGSAGSAAGNLRFSPYAKVNARIFVQLAQIPALIDSSWAQGARVSLRVDNLFDSHQRVRDATGATPLRYQPGYLDPAGRVIRIEFRKLFF
ncbi:TonB-dependent receptor [Sphingomonas sp. Root710]|uniref:TonB-dependent receptor plug domain-containing protein n=1 Tax=Sphingomonas sp. Root710 TaxID=1736594 RepID=UPI00070039DC|nr:TonB-dependent receptor plug domain-containing protein [Sphingomonas sp. Root710]KRB83100.1 TonB-dependent receptor [Sphingomonas sp. Root710]